MRHIWGGGVFTVVGNGGTVRTSPDGITWSSSTSGTTSTIYGVTYGNGTFVYVGGTNGVLATSTVSFPYNPSNQFQVPTDAQLGITVESVSNFKRTLYIRAL